MAATVGEIMNRELFGVSPTDSTTSALNGILALSISSAPVLDDVGRPIGVVSLRDLVGPKSGDTVASRMSAPAVVALVGSRIEDVAKLIGETGHRHLVVVDERGRAIGMVSTVDVVRALMGLPVRHPAAFPHRDAKTGVTWSDDTPLTQQAIEAAPDGPGVLALVHGAASIPERVVWVGSTNNVQTRLIDMLSRPQDDAELSRWLEHPEHLRFRTAAIPDRKVRERVAETVGATAHAGVLPIAR